MTIGKKNDSVMPNANQVLLLLWKLAPMKHCNHQIGSFHSLGPERAGSWFKAHPLFSFCMAMKCESRHDQMNQRDMGDRARKDDI